MRSSSAWYITGECMIDAHLYVRFEHVHACVRACASV
jgi:hypothetical protein